MNFTIDQTNLMIAGTRGDSGILNFNFIEDMRGYSAIFTVKKFADDSDDEALVTKYFDFPPLSSSATEAEMKTMTVYLNPEDTLGIVLDSDVSIKYNDYVWGLKINRGPVFSKTVIPLGAATFPKFRVYYGITDDWGNTSPYFNPDESSITVDIGLAVYGTQEQPVQTSFSIDATNLMITGTRGDSGLLSFIFSDDMRGYSVLFCIKKYQEDSDSDAILTKSFDFPALSSDATDIEKTVMTLSFIPEDTVSLDLNVEESVKYNDYVWGMKIFRGPVFSKTLIPSNGISFPKFRLFYGINKTWGNASPYYTGESSDINVDVTNVSYYITKPDLDFAIEQHNQFHYSHPFILSGLADLSASILSSDYSLSAHIYDFNNPHHVTKTQIGLGNVEDVSISGSISTHNSSLSAHDDIREYITTHIYDTDNPHLVSKEQVGLGNVDNTSDLNKPISTQTNSALSLKADLINGIVPVEQLPNITITDTFIVETSANLTTLSAANQGDIGIVTDISKTFILTQNPPSTIGNWITLATPTDSVISVNNKTGAVTLSASDIPGSVSTSDITGAVYTHNTNLSSHLDIRYDWYLDQTESPTLLKRYDDSTWNLQVEIISIIDKTLKLNGLNGSPVDIEIKTGKIDGGWSVISIDKYFIPYGVELTSLVSFYADDIISVGEDIYDGGAFGGCINLHYINLPKCTFIGPNSFSRLDKLTEIYLPNVNTLKDGAFYLRNTPPTQYTINLPELTGMSTFAIAGQPGLTGFNAPKLTTIADQCFMDCADLTSLDLVNVISIGADSFGYTPLTSLYFRHVEVVSNINTWSLSPSCIIKVPYEYLSQWQSLYGTLMIGGVWQIEGCEYDEMSRRVYAHNTSTDAHSGIVESLSSHTSDYSNPHGVTKSQIGLGSVENISISASIDTHNSSLSAHSNQFSPLSSHLTNYNNPHQVTKSQIGLGNVENISITGSINTHNTNLSAHLDIRYDWYLDGSAIKRYDDSTFSLTVSTISITDKTLAITSWSGSPIDIKIKTDSIKDGWSVTEITDYAFSADEGNTPCSTLVSIHCDDVKTVGVLSFFNCDALTSINFPEVLILKSRSFRSCNGLVDVYIPKASILYDGAFYQCSSLSTVSIPSVSSIGDGGFWNCTSLENVEIPQVTTIGLVCFQGTAVTNIYIPNVTYISDSAFAHCASLSSISIASAAILGDAPFMACNSLSSIYMPNVSTIGWGLLYQSSVSACDITLTVPQQVVGIDEWGLPPASKIKVPYEYLSNWKTLYPALLINNTWSIEAYSDNDASSRINAHNTSTDAHSGIIASINSHTSDYSNPHGVTKTQIGLGNVENISISGSISTHNINLSAHQDIRDSISQYPWYIDTTTTPYRLKRIDNDNFYFCVEVISTVDKTLKIIESDVQDNPNIVFPDTIDIPTGSIKDNWKVLQIHSANYYYSLSNIKILKIEDIQVIDDWACTGLYGCEELYLPNVTTIGTGAFSDMYALKYVYMPKVSNIPNYCFRYNTSITELILDNVITIGENIFLEGNTTLERIYAPKAITIGALGFIACAGLTEVYIPRVQTVGSYAFSRCSALATLSLDSCTSLGDYALLDTPVTDLYIPHIENIGTTAFGGYPLISMNITMINKTALSNITSWNHPGELLDSKIKVPFEYLSIWKADYPDLSIPGTIWSIEAYSDSDSSSRINAHNTSTDSHPDIRDEIGKCLSTNVLSGYDSSKQYAFSPNTDGTIKAGSLSEIIIPTVSFDNTTLTPNLSGSIQAVGVIDENGDLIDASEIRESINSVANAVFKNDTRHVSIGTDLFSLYNLSPVYRIQMPDYGFGYTISRIVVRCYSTPIKQLDANIMYCDTWTTGSFPSTNPTLVRAIDTTSGNYDSGAISINITSGKELYLLMDATVDYGTMWDITLTYQLGVN